MAAATSAAPHRRKQRIPPGPAAQAAAAALTGTTGAALLGPSPISPPTREQHKEGTPSHDHHPQHQPASAIDDGPGVALSDAEVAPDSVEARRLRRSAPTRARRSRRRGTLRHCDPRTTVGDRGRHRARPPTRRPAPLRLPPHTRHPRRLRLRRTTRRRPAVDQRTRHLPLPRDRHQRDAHRPARCRQDPHRRRPRPTSRHHRLPHLLHDRRRPRRTLPPRRDRRTLGDHHAVLRRTHPAW